MKSIPLYQPRISVKLRKTVMRERVGGNTPVSARYRGSMQEIDLTQHLGDAGGVQTNKSVRDPAGTFMITLADKPNSNVLGFETLYGLIEPMDFVEIRMLHGAQAGMPPVVMRGFVSRVIRSEAIDGAGKPVRTVVITGLDYGKIWQQLQIIYLPSYLVGQDILSNFKLFERFAIGFVTDMPGHEFVRQMIQKIVDPYLKKLMPENTTDPTSLVLDLTAKHGTISVDGPQSAEGTVYDLLRSYCDVGIWNELWIEDREEGPTVVFRPNPYKSVDGKKIQDDAPDAEVIDLPSEDVMAISVSRSDEDVANYFWTEAPRFDLVGDYKSRLWAEAEQDHKKREATIDLSKYPNTASNLYGVKLMRTATQMGGDSFTTSKSGRSKEENDQRDTGLVSWCGDRRRILVEQNRDNIVLESGTMHVRGNERIRAGTFVRLTRGTFTAEYYVVSVAHQFTPFQSFTSTLQVERGMGFVERSKREGGPDSPWLAEMQGVQ